MFRTLTAVAIGVGASLLTTSALAQTTVPPPPPPPRYAAPAPAPASSSDSSSDVPTGASVAALLGFGVGFNNGGAGYGFGFGARGGYTLPQLPIYVGGTLMYFTGVNNASTFMFGAEGGYDIKAGPVIVRPYLGLGAAITSFSYGGGNVAGFNVPSASASQTNFAFTLGGTVLYFITDNIFVGGDLRFMIVNNLNAMGIFATGGWHF